MRENDIAAIMNSVKPYSLFSDLDLYLFREGKHNELYKKFGAHFISVDGVLGVYFAVYAPAAKSVEVVGDFNSWSGGQHQLYVRWDGSGIWEGFVPGLEQWTLYKYRILSNLDDRVREKSDPYARATEVPPRTASLAFESRYNWNDEAWIGQREATQSLDRPLSIYEVHLGSFMRNAEGEYLRYHELADSLVDYVKRMHFTHVEFMPLSEHPYSPSWGYQITNYFSPTSRFGTPDDLKYLIDRFHQEGIGVIMDWVPAHFPSDTHGLADFDGSKVYEHPDFRKGYHPDWNSMVFNYERSEVRSFLKSSARYWLDEFHVDGLRVDAVASMIYLDYSRQEGEWTPNIYGGKEYLAAISFLSELNTEMYAAHPGIHMIAEESTSFDGVTKPADNGGLGFGLKWMMGWMNDILEYFSKDPIYRKYHHSMVTFSIVYAFSEQFVLPFSHDEVVHGKGSMITKMPGDEWQKFANLRLLYGYMWAHPGSKLLFMGNEFAQYTEWNHDKGLDWHLTQYPYHSGVQKLVGNLNELYQSEAALFELNYSYAGFEWLDHSNASQSIISFFRKGKEEEVILVVCNFTPISYDHYRIDVPYEGDWQELLNTDESQYNGSGVVNSDTIEAQLEEHEGFSQSFIEVRIPPLGTTYLKRLYNGAKKSANEKQKSK